MFNQSQVQIFRLIEFQQAAREDEVQGRNGVPLLLARDFCQTKFQKTNQRGIL